MKKIIITAIFATIFSFGAYEQKYALVDMEYILKNTPQYEMANEQLNQVSLRWQKEVETKTKEAVVVMQIIAILERVKTDLHIALAYPFYQFEPCHSPFQQKKDFSNFYLRFRILSKVLNKPPELAH